MATIARTAAVGSRWRAERIFYTSMTAAIFLAVVVGFSRSFFLRPLFPEWPAPSEPIFFTHGVVFTAWFVLSLVQPPLVATGRTRLHKRLGAAAALLVVAMVVLGVQGAIVAARRETGFTGIPVPPLQFLAIPFFDMLIFPAFVALGLANRRQPQTHKRWMLLASIAIMGAAVARWPGVIAGGPLAFFALTDMFLVPLAIWDYASRGRLHPVTLWGGLVLIVSQPLRLWVSETGPWLAFAAWLTGLGG